MSTQIAVPVFCYAAPKIHQLNHTVTDATPGFICTETTGADSFSQNSVIRCKEIRCDRNVGKVRTTGLIVSNKNQVQSGQIVSDSAIYDDVGGVTTPKIVTFDNTINNAALVVRSGGAYIGDGARIDGPLTANQVSITGTSTFSGLVTASGGVSTPTISQPIITATTRLLTPEIDTGADVNLLLKRNSNTIATLEANSLTINTGCYLKNNFQPRFCFQLGYDHTASAATLLGTWLTNLVNVTGSFNGSTGRFTAPVAGHYRFSVYTHSTTTATIVLYLRVNGLNPEGFEFAANNTSTFVNKPILLSCIFNLAANETVAVFTGTTGVFSSATTFSGELISIT